MSSSSISVLSRAAKVSLMVFLLFTSSAISPLVTTKNTQDLFNKIASSCFEKCASRRHKDNEISLGEMSCVDRCVSKYLESQQRVGAVLQKANEAQLEQQKNLEAMQKQFG